MQLVQIRRETLLCTGFVCLCFYQCLTCFMELNNHIYCVNGAPTLPLAVFNYQVKIQ